MDPVRVDFEAHRFHIGKYRRKRQLNLGGHARHAGFRELIRKNRIQFADRPDRLRVVQGVRKRQCLFPRQPIDGIAASSRIEKVACKHRIEHARIGHASRFFDQTLDVVADERFLCESVQRVRGGCENA